MSVPGPDFLVVVRSAADSPARGRAAAPGARTGLCVHMLAAAAGLSPIADRSPVVYGAVELLGAAYLVHLGVRAVLAARAHGTGTAAPRTNRRAAGRASPRDFSPTCSTRRRPCSSSASCRSWCTARAHPHGHHGPHPGHHNLLTRKHRCPAPERHRAAVTP
ncbi:LysE family transporter [Streptomyces sp. T12]|uniref:LysE family translocator n=1 Tax=unclassified Streptomyces TaxID=2593676 RepID=UPI0021BD12AA|nr:LysE family transporter [Streptomyces sp. T12]